MTRLTVDLPGAPYPIIIGQAPDLAAALLPALGPGSVCVVADSGAPAAAVAGLQEVLGDRCRLVVTQRGGEAAKSLGSAECLYGALAEADCGRDTTLIALGGGAVGDLTGFVAATWQRGVAWVQMPTTLLAMVDAAVGGKTALNLPTGKNLVGAFHQPQAVIADLRTLTSLPEREYRAGLAEVIKYGVALDADLLDWLESALDRLLSREPATLEEAVVRCCRIKAAVVVRDEREQGERALLNLGHSFGHALERWAGPDALLHGEAVAIGLVMEARLGAALGHGSGSLTARISRLLTRAGLAIDPPPGATLAALLPALRRDKKNRAGTLRLVLPSAPGRAALVTVAEAELGAAFPDHAPRSAHG